MRLAFAILCHDAPHDAADLAKALVDAASDGVAVFHFDAAAKADDFAALKDRVAADDRLFLTARRRRCGWGSYGLVDATFLLLEEIDRQGGADRVILLSGGCLPARPVAALERYLSAHPGREFIEAQDASWMKGGLRHERYSLYFPFDMRRTPRLHHAGVIAQRLAGVRRKMPLGLEARFGSQWWCLTGATCRALLAFRAENPKAMRFFESTFIPDELVIQTLTHRLAEPGAIANFTLTHFSFNEKGKPRVFHDDHVDLVPQLNRFFFRKAFGEARRLRDACLAIAAAPDDGQDLSRIGEPDTIIETRIAAQTGSAKPGQVHLRSQANDAAFAGHVLAHVDRPFTVVFGPPAPVDTVRRAFADLDVDIIPTAFDDRPDPRADRPSSVDGLIVDAPPLRALHPELHLARAIDRCARHPVILWSPLIEPDLFERLSYFEQALRIVRLPLSYGPKEGRRRLARSLARRAGASAREPADDVQARAIEAQLSPDLDKLLRASNATTADAPTTVFFPYAPEDQPETALQRREVLARLKTSIDDSAFRSEEWFLHLSQALLRAALPPRERSAPEANGGARHDL